jgi:hypothetical protein
VPTAAAAAPTDHGEKQHSSKRKRARDNDNDRAAAAAEAAAAVAEPNIDNIIFPMDVVVDSAAAAAEGVVDVADDDASTKKLRKMDVVVDAAPPAAAAAATWNYMEVDTDDDGNRVETTLTMYSAEERKWLNEKVRATLFRQLTRFMAPPGCVQPPDIEPFSRPEKIAIDCAVQFYHEKRVARQWTETGKALIDHVILDADFKQYPPLCELWNIRIAARPEEEEGKEDGELLGDFDTYDSDAGSDCDFSSY